MREITQEAKDRISAHYLFSTASGMDHYKVDEDQEENRKLLIDLEDHVGVVMRMAPSIEVQKYHTLKSKEQEREIQIGAMLHYELKEYNGACGSCGGTLAEIRGRTPGEEKRKVCPTCLMEKIEGTRANLYPYNQASQA